MHWTTVLLLFLGETIVFGRERFPQSIKSMTIATSDRNFIQGLIMHPSSEDGISFDFEKFVSVDLGVNLQRALNQEVCQYYLKNQCRLGE